MLPRAFSPRPTLFAHVRRWRRAYEVLRAFVRQRTGRAPEPTAAVVDSRSTWEERYWAPLNVPVLGPDAAVRHLIHRVEDVTEVARLAAEGDRLRGAAAGSERARASAEAARAELAVANAQLEDHAPTFVTDVALALRTMRHPGGEPAALLRDGTAILATIAERHGAQRARLGWPEAAIAREFALLAEVLDGAVRRLAAAGAGGAAAAERAAAVVARLLDQAARLSLSGSRLATGAAGAKARSHAGRPTRR